MSKLDIRFEWTPDTLGRAVTAWQRIIEASVGDPRPVESWGERNVRPYTDEGNTAHVTELVISDGEETEHRNAMRLALVDYSDYGGTCWDAALVKYLRDTETHGVNISEGRHHGEVSAWVQVGEVWGDDDYDGADPDTGIGWVERLAELMEGYRQGEIDFLSETHDEWVKELAEDAWDQYLRADLIRELEQALPKEADGYPPELGEVTRIGEWVDDPRDVDDMVRVTYYAFVEQAPFNGMDGWRTEYNSPTSVVVERATHEAAVKHVLTTIFGHENK